MLELKNVSIKRNRKNFLENISLHAEAGEIISVIGVENSGKTLLLKAISRNTDISSGEILFNSVPISGMKHRKLAEILVHPFSKNIGSGKTVYNIVTHSRLRLKNFFHSLNADDTAEINAQISAFDLTGIKHSRYNSLTDGEKQRTDLAFLFSGSGKVLILEKPELHLDLHSLSLLSRAIQKYVLQGDRTIIMENCSLNAALENSDRIICMQNGRIIMDKKNGDYSEEDFKRVFGTELYLTKNLVTGKNMVASVNVN